MQLPSCYALADLPWFELRGERLLLADGAVGPIVDVHTHLALTYGRRRSVDLNAAPRPTEHYLPLSAPLDMQVYQNVNFTPQALSAMKRDLGLGSFTSGGMRATHTAPNLTREMEELGVVRSVLLPIDMPWLSYNAETYLDIAAYTPSLVSFGSVHPSKKEARAALEEQKQKGALGIKVHPAVQMMPPDHPKAMALYEMAGEIGLPILWHCGPVGIETALGRRYSQVKHYWRAIAQHPKTTFILGHSGALQMDMGLELAQRYPNVYLEVASQGLDNVKHLVREAPIERLMFGSDWPFYHQAIGIAKVLLATEGLESERRLVLHDNAARLLSLQS